MCMEGIKLSFINSNPFLNSECSISTIVYCDCILRTDKQSLENIFRTRRNDVRTKESIKIAIPPPLTMKNCCINIEQPHLYVDF